MTDYNHMSNDVMEAIGVTREELDKTMMFMQKAFQFHHPNCWSIMIQYVESAFDSAPQAFKRLIIMLAVQSYVRMRTDFAKMISGDSSGIEGMLKGVLKDGISGKVSVELNESLKRLAKELDASFRDDSNPDENDDSKEG